MADKKLNPKEQEKLEKPKNTEQNVEINVGNIEILTLKLLNDINNNLKRIVIALEK